MSLVEKFRLIASPSLVSVIPNTIPDLQRILALPRRKPYVCERDGNGIYPPNTQALVEFQTEKFTRGTRVSCACRPRHVRCDAEGQLTIFRQLPEGMIPEPPIHTTINVFLTDCNPLWESEMMKQVMALRPGQAIDLPAADSTKEQGNDCIIELSPPQAWFLYEAAQEGGAVGFMGVGSGKSIAFLLAALLYADSRLAVLLIEPKQRQHYKSQYLRLREHFKVSSISSDRISQVVPGTTPLHLISYSVLSRTENSDLLDDLEPDTLMLDEAHRACGDSAINRRTKRYVTKQIKKRVEAMGRGEPVRARAVRVLDASGTLETESITDTQMLCTFSLGTGSPIPNDPNEAAGWSNVMDLSYKPDRKSATAMALHRYFGDGFIPDEIELSMLLTDNTPEKKVREGFQKWRSETPGIITAASSDVNASIYFGAFELPKMPKLVQDALTAVRVTSQRPDGEELIEKIEQIACAKNVACGFYSYWAFPKHPCTCPKERTITRSENWCEQCCLIDDWYRFRKLFFKALRALTQKGWSQLDSQKLCEDAAARAWVDGGLHDSYPVYCDTCWRQDKKAVEWPCEIGHNPAWREVAWINWSRIENRVEYEERHKWIGCECPGQCKGCAVSKDAETHPGYWLARHVAKWAKKNKAVIWVKSVPLGRKIAELAGIPYFNGGPGGEDRLRAEKGNRSIVCTIKAHGGGTDGLQEIFEDQVIVEIPSSNAKETGLEQVLGRLHRRGQPAKVVNTLAAIPSFEFMDSLRKALAQAAYNYQMTKIRQKILIADLDIDGL